MEGTLIVAILAVLIALGGMVLGIVNYFHTRKVDKRTTRISEEQSQIPFEQRKWDSRQILLEARIACSNAKGQYDLVAIQSDIADMDYEQELNQLRTSVEETMRTIDQLRDGLSMPMSRLELEEAHGHALELSTAAKQVEASATNAYDFLKDLNSRRPGT